MKAKDEFEAKVRSVGTGSLSVTMPLGFCEVYGLKAGMIVGLKLISTREENIEGEE